MSDLIQSANAQIEAILNKFGLKYRKGFNSVMGCCPVHCGDNLSAFSYNFDKRIWTCFTRSCQREWGNDVLGLVAGILQGTKDEAKSWLIENIEELDYIPEIKIEKRIDKIYPEYIVKKLFKTDFYVKRGFSQETVDSFEHGKAEAHTMRNRIVFPIRDENGLIRGFSGRWAGKEELKDGKKVCVTNTGVKVPKWKHTSFNKTDYLYRFNVVKPFIKDEVIVVESIGNVMRFWDAGFNNCVAIMGSSISFKQVQLILSSSKGVVLAFDNDKAGLKALKKAHNLFDPYLNVKELLAPEGVDWADLNNAIVKELYGKINKK